MGKSSSQQERNGAGVRLQTSSLFSALDSAVVVRDRMTSTKHGIPLSQHLRLYFSSRTQFTDGHRLLLKLKIFLSEMGNFASCPCIHFQRPGGPRFCAGKAWVE